MTKIMPQSGNVACPVCKGSKKSPSSDTACLCCEGKGEISKERDAILARVRSDLSKRLAELGIVT